MRTRHAVPMVDLRQLSELLPRLEPHGSNQINRSQAVNPRRTREIRPNLDDAWKFKLDPPVSLVLPISRRSVAGLWECFGESALRLSSINRSQPALRNHSTTVRAR